MMMLAAGQQNKTQSYSCGANPFGYYCIDEQNYLWCYGQDTPMISACVSGLECKCGYTLFNPCMWPYQTTDSSCQGKPGSIFGPGTDTTPSESIIPTESSILPPISSSEKSIELSESSEPVKLSSSEQLKPPITESSSIQPELNYSSTPSIDWPDYEEGIYYMEPNEHLPLVLKFEPTKWRLQIRSVLANPHYNDHGLYQPSTGTYECSLHPPEKYDHNPTQIWIGRPSSTVSISYTPDVLIRLPDKYYGMFLGYAMDMYGLNPAMLIGLGAKESFSFARYGATDDGSLFIVKNEDEEYDCYSSSQRGLCRDQNLDGPFQVETGGMATDVAILPNRFWIGDQSTPKKDRQIKYMYDNEVLTSEGFREFHDSYTLHNGRATVLTSLDFHFRHNMIMNLQKLGLVDALALRTTRESRDSLEFATAMYTYNRGVFDTQLITMLENCKANMDPCIDCKLDGYGGHTTDIRTVCIAVDKVPESELYDFDISAENVVYFLETLESTYPFDNVNWNQVKSDVDEAYQYLASFRLSGKISFRYDWRTLLAVIRMHLPKIEYFVGDQVRSFQAYWGNVLNKDNGSYIDPSKIPFNFCSTSGGRKNLCFNNPVTVL